MHRLLQVALVAGALAAPAAATAQSSDIIPAGWEWRLDAPAKLVLGSRNAMSDTTFDFVHMAPGWHIAMGPGSVLFDPRERAEGRFMVEGELILFPNASGNEYGVFVGGRGLEGATGNAGANAQWIAFVVRADGSAAVLKRTGGAVSELLPWAVHASVKPKVRGGTAKNIVSVRAEPDSVRFFVNGERLGAWPRADLPVDGAFGFRIGKGVNLHVTNLDATRRLAPFPARR